MKQMAEWLDTGLRYAMMALLIALVVAVSWQVVSRYVFSAPSSWTEEVARFLLIWITLLGAAYACRARVHLCLDLLSKNLTGVPAKLLEGFSHAVIILFSLAVLVLGGGKLVALTWELKQYSAVLGVPMAFVYSVIPLAGLLICIFSVVPQVDPPTAPTEGQGIKKN